MGKADQLGAAEMLDRYYGRLLSKRELEIGQLAVTGMPTNDIAERMYLAVNTVKTHLKQVFRKTGTENRNDLYRKLVALQFDTGQAGKAPPVAERDPLTGWLHPESFPALLAAKLNEVRRRNHELSLLRIGWEGNPEHVEQILGAIGGAFLTCVRGTDQVFRWTDAQFQCILPDCGITSARYIAARLVQKANALAAGRNIRLRLTAGVASTEEGWQTVAELLEAVNERVNATGEAAPARS